MKCKLFCEVKSEAIVIQMFIIYIIYIYIYKASAVDRQLCHRQKKSTFCQIGKTLLLIWSVIQGR